MCSAYESLENIFSRKPSEPNEAKREVLSHFPQVNSIPEKDDDQDNSQTVSTSLTEEDSSPAESNDTLEAFNYTIA